MKLIAPLFLAIIFLSCKGEDQLTKEEEQSLQLQIQGHNIDAEEKFRLDSVREITNIELQYVGLPKDKVQEYIDAHMKVFTTKWNTPYNIKKDRRLTLEEYLKYCKVNNYKPVEYIDYIR